MRRIWPLILALMMVTSGAWADSCGPSRGETGRFDLFLLSLSWSPGFCATDSGRANPEQCQGVRRFGFIVHGLWPQYASGSWPQCCRAAPFRPSAASEAMAGSMPGQSLRRHEWEKHGSCVSPRQDDYFALIDRAVKTHGLGGSLTAGERIRVSDLKRHWPGLPAQAVTVRCKGKALAEVRLCLERDLSPRPCPAAIRDQDNCPGTVTVP
ncbi:ribonuclease I [Paramagnetospirillum marisnigri]|uniref:Ribonuclease I n=1 Tax=Paramagnetospirillum marisnigri TaxID=1285242 RepID=A0A178MTZ5_9PROT|nr:ribonuclease I [Paramagnetospirillum marisnigri]OAN53740.1 ribonuclease I [Paramagnetospirillum marisnigri]